MRSPWGTVDSTREYVPGVLFVSTPSHGGFKLDRSHNAQVNAAWRRKGGYYEEDCEYAIVVLTFPYLFTSEELEAAHKSAKDWLPDAYEIVFRVIVPAEESFVKRERHFAQENKQNWVVIAAFGDWHPDVPKGMVGVVATEGGERRDVLGPAIQERYFLVPTEEYRQRQYQQSFVVDLAKHKEVRAFLSSKTAVGDHR